MKLTVCQNNFSSNGFAPPCRRNQLKHRLLSTIILLLFTTVFFTTRTVAQTITLNEKKAPLKKVLESIKKQSGYSVFYDDKLLQQSVPVDVAVNNATLTVALDAVFQNQPLTYEVVGNKIISIKLKPKTQTTNLPATPASQSIALTGTVRSEEGQALEGATLSVKNSPISTVVNAAGEYSIVLPGNSSTLEVSYVGYQTKEITITSNEPLNIVLTKNASALNDVVVVGYGAQKRKDVTGAVSSINEKTLREVPVTNATQLIQGRVAGAFVTQSSNIPGAQPTIRIRGTRSFGAAFGNSNLANDPLYVVDGIPIQGGFNDINPNDIESIDILKDASATAIYGSRGANGVIIITTKRGKIGKPTISYNTYFGITHVTRFAPMMNATQFLNLIREAYRKADGTIPPDQDILSAEALARVKAGNNTDWQQLVTEDGFQQNHELSVRGGTKSTRYNLSVGAFDDQGYFKTQNFRRYTTRINLDQEITSHIKAGISMLGSFSETNTPGSYYWSMVESPFGVPYKADGTLDPQPNFPDNLMWNPLADLQPGVYINKNKRFRLLSALYVEAEIIKGLKIRTNFGPDLANGRNGVFRGSLSTQSRGSLPSASNSENFVLYYTTESYFTYDKTIADKHRINLTGLYSYQQQTTESSTVSAINLPVESVEYYNLGAGVYSAMGSGYEKWSLQSYMGRLNYTFNDKLLVTLTARADGSSRFAPGNQWGFFPSGAIAYNLSNESFIQGVPWVDNLKLRVSYGQVGNTGIPAYTTQGILGTNVYEFGGTRAPGRQPSSIRNPDLKWERTAKANIGIDFGLWKSRLTGTVEVYNETTTDLLLPFALPGTTGFSSTLRNVGSTRNKGVELTLSTQNFVSRNDGFQWSSDVTFAYNKEQILELSQGKFDDLANRRFIGQPLDVLFDYEKIGIWQTSEAADAAIYGLVPGQIKVRDQNGDKRITTDDRKILGRTRPPVTIGFNNRFSFKGFDLTVLTVANSGYMLVSPIHGNNYNTLVGRYNNLNLDYWTPTNPTNAFPKPRISGNQYLSTLAYFDASFIRIRNASLGYNIPTALAQKIKAQSIRAYVNVTNPYIFSSYVHKYNGIDNEILETPATINILFGLNVNF
jgi:TonB-linked SusC/RagA family outer membrane protein